MNQDTARIVSIECYLPEKILTNNELEKLFLDWTADKIYSKTGVLSRHIASESECSSDLGIEAARKLFNSNSIDVDSIDVLIFCTETPDYLIPTTACIIQDKLGLSTSCSAFDINLGCSGFVYGLSIAKAYICSNMANNVLLITAETYSKIINPKDKSVRTIFGDAGCATLISSGEGTANIGNFVLGTDGTGHKNLIVPTSGFRMPKNPQTAIEQEDNSGNVRSLDNLYMNGSSIFTFTITTVPKAINQFFQKYSLSLDDIDWFVFHQANKYMVDHLVKKMNIPESKAPICIEEYGNTVSSSIPITLKDCQEKGMFQKNDKILLVGFGIGYSWGVTLLEWHG